MARKISWEEIIKPALADQIKAFVEFIDLIEEPYKEDSEDLTDHIFPLGKKFI